MSDPQASRWFVVEAGVSCMFGHQIETGTWARWGVLHDGNATCAECLWTRYKVERPGVDWSSESRQLSAGSE